MECSAHLHFKLKMLILPLPAEEITRNGDSDWLPKGGARPQRTRDQVLERKQQDGIRGKRERKKSTWRQQDVTEVEVWHSNKGEKSSALHTQKERERD